MDPEMNEWLQGVLNQGEGELPEESLQALLGDDSLTDADLDITIQFVETWLSLGACPYLTKIVILKSRSHAVRLRAAQAMSNILDEESAQILISALMRR